MFVHISYLTKNEEYSQCTDQSPLTQATEAHSSHYRRQKESPVKSVPQLTKRGGISFLRILRCKHFTYKDLMSDVLKLHSDNK